MSPFLWLGVGVFCFVGLLCFLFCGGLASIRREVRNMSSDTPAWKKAAFAVATGLGCVLLWPIMLPGMLKESRSRSVWDELQENPLFQQQKALHDMMSLMCEDGCDADEFPNGRGEFGHVVTNPIPTKTVFGSTSYLARLRAPDGAKVVYERLGSTASEVTQNPVDIYRVSHPNGTELATLYISPYQKRISAKAPRGFTLVATILETQRHD